MRLPAKILCVLSISMFVAIGMADQSLPPDETSVSVFSEKQPLLELCQAEFDDFRPYMSPTSLSVSRQ